MVTEVPILPVGRYDNQIFIHGHDVAETLHFLLHQVPVPVTGNGREQPFHEISLWVGGAIGQVLVML